MATTATFPRFPDLPPELRTEIWRHALPIRIAPALFTFKGGCWKPCIRTASDRDYQPDNPSANRVVRFQHDQLRGGMRLKLALLCVNSEARDVVLAWAVKQPGVEVLDGTNKNHKSDDGGPIVLCRFDPERDCVFVHFKDWEEFNNDQALAFLESGWHPLDPRLGLECDIKRIAVPNNFFLQRNKHWRELYALTASFTALGALYIVAGPLPAVSTLGADDQVHQWRCEIDDISGAQVSWDRNLLKWSLQNQSGDSQLQFVGDVVWQAIRELDRGVMVQESFTVRQVSLVKRHWDDGQK